MDGFGLDGWKEGWFGWMDGRRVGLDGWKEGGLGWTDMGWVGWREGWVGWMEGRRVGLDRYGLYGWKEELWVRQMEEMLTPFSSLSPRPCLRVLDMTGIQDGAEHGPDGVTLWSGTVLLAKACLEASQRRTEPRGAKRRKGSPVPLVEIRVDLFVNSTSGAILKAALRSGGAVRLRCRDFHAEELSLGGTVDLLEALEPVGLRRVELRFNNLGLEGLCQVVPRLARFPDLASVRLPYSNVDVRRPGTEDGLRELAEALGWLRGLRELNLGSCRLAGRLRLLLG